MSNNAFGQLIRKSQVYNNVIRYDIRSHGTRMKWIESTFE